MGKKLILTVIFFLTAYSGSGQNVFYNFPKNYQFYERDSLGFSAVNIFGSVTDESYKAIKLTILQNGKSYFSEKHDLEGDKKFSWNTSLVSGLFEYDFELKLFLENDSSSVASASKVLSGDTYLIYGQSNAVAGCCFDMVRSEVDDTFLRNYVFDHFDPNSTNNGWHDLGVEFNWPGVIGSRIAENIIRENHIPVQIINGAVGGQSLEALVERDFNNPENPETYYGRFLKRIMASSSLKPKGFIFSQGEWESDTGVQGAIDSYNERFNKFISDLKSDGVEPRYYYLVQTNIPTTSYVEEAPAKLRDIQRQLKKDFPKMSMYAAFGRELSGDGLHYARAGYEGIADDIFLGINSDTYGAQLGSPVTGPLIQKAVLSDQQQKITLVFDEGQSLNVQNVKDFGHYQRRMKDYIYDGNGEPFIDSVKAEGNEVALYFSKDFGKDAVTYLPSVFTDSYSLNYNGPLIENQNGLPALSFSEFKTCEALDKPMIYSFKSNESGVSLFIENQIACNACTYEVFGKPEGALAFKYLGSYKSLGDSLYVDLSWSGNSKNVSLKVKVVSDYCQSDYTHVEVTKCSLMNFRGIMPLVSEELISVEAFSPILTDKNELILNPSKFWKPMSATQGQRAFYNKIGQCVNN
ncbi:sialate O-acetylesterase [uncultured Arcticibacterium sp.]|uniref:sialate O-acetylesterase n=1 Tax=uncultured Arcticibacterium sp. TaxID=2173042 RepID=UPI0030F6A78C